jgi:hypothetical protein
MRRAINSELKSIMPTANSWVERKLHSDARKKIDSLRTLIGKNARGNI